MEKQLAIIKNATTSIERDFSRQVRRVSLRPTRSNQETSFYRLEAKKGSVPEATRARRGRHFTQLFLN
jgi:hypothetical protein